MHSTASMGQLPLDPQILECFGNKTSATPILFDNYIIISLSICLREHALMRVT